MTVVAQQDDCCSSVGKAPGIHGYVAGSIPAVTPRYCTTKTRIVLRSTKKRLKKDEGEIKVEMETVKHLQKWQKH